MNPNDQRHQNVPFKFWSDMTGTICRNLIQIKEGADSDCQRGHRPKLKYGINIACTQNSVYGYR